MLSHQNAWRFRQKRTAKPPFLNFEQGLAWLSRRHGSDVVYHVAHETGIAIGTVQNWFRRRNGIRGDHQLILMAVYPPGLTRAFLGEAAPDWLVAACDAEQQARDERRERLKADLKRARAAL